MFAGSPFGLKLSAASSSLTGATVTGPAGSPAGISIDLGVTNPERWRQGQLHVQSAGRFAGIDSADGLQHDTAAGRKFRHRRRHPTATAANLNAALNTAIGTLANTSLVAASAMQAGNDFFNTTGTATGSVVNNQATVPGPITGATALSGAAGTDSLGASFGVGDTITVNGTPITFVASGATGNQLNVTDNVQSLLSKIDSITGTSTPSTISGGVISIHTDDAASLSVSSSNSTAFAALGFSGTATAVTPPLRIGANTTTAAGSLANNQATTPRPITGATLLSGAAGTDSLSNSFAVNDTITVNGTPITFVAAGATGNQVNITDSLQTLLSKIDSITSTSTPSAVSGGVISLHTDNGSGLTVTSSNTAAFAALGFSATGTATGVATQPSSLVAGTPANTVKWYTGNPGPTASARATATARIDASVKVQYGIQADEPAIRLQLQTLAVFSAVTTSTTNPNGAAQSIGAESAGHAGSHRTAGTADDPGYPDRSGDGAGHDE